MPLYTAYIDGGQGGDETFAADTLEEAGGYVEDWARAGDWDDGSGPPLTTFWVNLRIDGPDGETLAHYDYGIDPDEPPCVDDEGHSDPNEPHEWSGAFDLVGGIESNPGVWASGGGVVIFEGCTRCGCQKAEDTWAQNPDTGEQGLRAITYTPGHYPIGTPTEQAS